MSCEVGNLVIVCRSSWVLLLLRGLLIVSSQRQKFRDLFPNRGEGLRTGMGKVIGQDLPKMTFVSTLEWKGRNFNFLRFVDYVDAAPGSCANPLEYRHYLMEWEGEGELSWTHCNNIDDHLSGLQEFYDDVTG
jgi:hypothetical protein